LQYKDRVLRGMFHEVADKQAVEVKGHLKWFNYVKGYGFVTTDDGQDVFLHLSCLRKAGLSFIEEGSEIWCNAVDGTRGLQAVVVTQVRPVVASDQPMQYQSETAEAMGQSGSGMIEPEGELLDATVKWFNKIRGYGFLNVENSAADIFLHVEVLRRCGIALVQPGDRLKVTLEEGDKGLAAKSAYPVAE
jgi:CspA family cold shock protein